VFTSLRLGADAIAALGRVTLRLVATDVERSWLVATDVERSWLVRADGTALSWTSPAGEAAAADLVLEAPAGTLLLLLWGRLDAAACRTSGDLDVAARWRTHIAF
jgi:predicted lipid carrier protein YhbT